MRLLHPLLSSPIHWRENEIPVLVIERPEPFRSMFFSLSTQAEEEEGEAFCLLDESLCKLRLDSQEGIIIKWK